MNIQKVTKIVIAATARLSDGLKPADQDQQYYTDLWKEKQIRLAIKEAFRALSTEALVEHVRDAEDWLTGRGVAMERPSRITEELLDKTVEGFNRDTSMDQVTTAALREAASRYARMMQAKPNAEVALRKEEFATQRTEDAIPLEKLAQMHANDAELGRKLRELVSGGKFDLTDSPASFVTICRQLVADQDAQLAPVEK